MPARDYPVVIRWSDEDQLVVAHVPDLPGCMAHGDTEAEALVQIGEAIELWIEVAREFREAVPEPGSSTHDWFVSADGR